MTDEQLKSMIGVDETMQMLQFRELAKSQVTPEEYAQNMDVHKASIQLVMDANKCKPVEAGEWILDQLDADKSMDEDQKEIWKAWVVLAAFEMQEF